MTLTQWKRPCDFFIGMCYSKVDHSKYTGMYEQLFLFTAPQKWAEMTLYNFKIIKLNHKTDQHLFTHTKYFILNIKNDKIIHIGHFARFRLLLEYLMHCISFYYYHLSPRTKLTKFLPHHIFRQSEIAVR